MAKELWRCVVGSRLARPDPCGGASGGLPKGSVGAYVDHAPWRRWGSAAHPRCGGIDAGPPGTFTSGGPTTCCPGATLYCGCVGIGGLPGRQWRRFRMSESVGPTAALPLPPHVGRDEGGAARRVATLATPATHHHLLGRVLKSLWRVLGRVAVLPVHSPPGAAAAACVPQRAACCRFLPCEGVPREQPSAQTARRHLFFSGLGAVHVHRGGRCGAVRVSTRL